MQRIWAVALAASFFAALSAASAGGFLALAILALWAGTRGGATTITLLAGTVLFALGSGTPAGRAYAAAAAALGIALLVEGLAVHATGPSRPLLGGRRPNIG